MELGETTVTAMATAVSAVGESVTRTGETVEEVDPKIAAAK